ncbi:MAG: RHS repeat-associated core domain-containing protein [Fimbriimonadaceae bacterium]
MRDLHSDYNSATRDLIGTSEPSEGDRMARGARSSRNAGGFGYQEDPDHGLKLLGHRYYDSSTGRFLSRDPAEDGRNWYTYCGNNPVRFFDDFGLDRHDALTLSVDPAFKGRVTAIGETDDTEEQTWIEVPGGHKTVPWMDVDYVIVEHPDGDTKRYFIAGAQPAWDNMDTHQYALIRDDGTLSADGIVIDLDIESMTYKKVFGPRFRRANRKVKKKDRPRFASEYYGVQGPPRPPHLQAPRMHTWL